MNYNERKQWLKARIGKKVFHSELECSCNVCMENGFTVTKDNIRYWLDYTADMGLKLKQEI